MWPSSTSVLGVRVREVSGKFFFFSFWESLNWHVSLSSALSPASFTGVRLGVRQPPCDHEKHNDGKNLGSWQHLNSSPQTSCPRVHLYLHKAWLSLYFYCFAKRKRVSGTSREGTPRDEYRQLGQGRGFHLALCCIWGSLVVVGWGHLAGDRHEGKPRLEASAQVGEVTGQMA